MINQRTSAAYAERLAALLRVRTVSEQKQTDLTSFYQFHALLAGMFPLTFERSEIHDLDGNLFLRLAGGDKPPLMLMSHMDVVSASGEWKYEPFSGTIAEGRVWGRGAVDTKGNLWAILESVEQLLEDGAELPRDLYIVSSRTEETDGSGARAICAFMQENGYHPFALLDEGGMIIEEPIGGVKGRYAMVGVAEKIVCDMRFVAKGGGGHASAPDRNSPLVRLGRFMCAAEKKKLFKPKLNRTTREMFRRMVPGMSGAMRFLFGSMWLTKPIIIKALPSVSATGAAMLRTTLAFTMAGGSESINSMPSEAYIVGDMRCSLHQGVNKSLSKVKKLAKRFDIETDVFDKGDESAATDYTGKAFKAVEKTVGEIFSDVVVTPYIMNGASDSRFYAPVCTNRIRFAPFVISGDQLDSMHAANESIDVEALPPAVTFYKKIIFDM